MTNIVMNAYDVLVDYETLEEKKIEIVVSKETRVNEEGIESTHIAIEVTNNGPHIDEEFAKEIFEPFKTKGKKDGTGLGLAIARNVVRAHEGILILKDNHEGKATFQITIPRENTVIEEKTLELAVSPRMEEINEPEPKEEGGISYTYEMRAERERTILIIDDEPLVRESVKQLIEDEEEFSLVKTILASDGEKVIDLIEKHRVEYVISDYRLGDDKLNGMGILEKIKSYKKDIPVLLMSNHRTPDESFDAIMKGAAGFIVKPVCRGDIRGLVESKE